MGTSATSVSAIHYNDTIDVYVKKVDGHLIHRWVGNYNKLEYLTW